MPFDQFQLKVFSYQGITNIENFDY